MNTPRDPAITSRMMAAVRSKNSKAELLLRRELHGRGLRYHLHSCGVTGRPDIVFPKWRVALFVDGDFWHGNAWRLRGLSSLDDLFPTRREFWVAKIGRTMNRDKEVTANLTTSGWKVLRFWESDILNDVSRVADVVLHALGEIGYLSPVRRRIGCEHDQGQINQK